MNSCKNCGHCTRYNSRRGIYRYECAFGNVDPDCVCDRYQPDCSPAEIMRKIDRDIKRLNSVPDGKYELIKRPPFGQNYRVVGKTTA